MPSSNHQGSGADPDGSGDICPAAQLDRCAAAHHRPDQAVVARMTAELGATGTPEVTGRAIIVDGLDEQRRYYIQHSLGYQVHDRAKPHHHGLHGRAEIGWASQEPSPAGRG